MAGKGDPEHEHTRAIELDDKVEQGELDHGEAAQELAAQGREGHGGKKGLDDEFVASVDMQEQERRRHLVSAPPQPVSPRRMDIVRCRRRAEMNAVRCRARAERDKSESRDKDTDKEREREREREMHRLYSRTRPFRVGYTACSDKPLTCPFACTCTSSLHHPSLPRMHTAPPSIPSKAHRFVAVYMQRRHRSRLSSVAGREGRGCGEEGHARRVGGGDNEDANGHFAGGKTREDLKI